MRLTRTLAMTFLCVLATLAWQGPAHAQFDGVRVSGMGTVIGGQNFQLLVRDDAGNQALLDYNPERVHEGITIAGLPNPKAQVVGIVDRTAIHQFFTVRVTGKVQDLEKFTDPITEITVTGTQIDPATSYGVFPDNSVNVTDEEADLGIQGFVVSGQITQLRGDRITIAAPIQGNGNEFASIKATIAPDAVVHLDVNDFRLAGVGDRVEFEGYTMDGRRVFVFTSTFTKPEPEGDAAPAPAGQQQPFGAGIDEPAEDAPAPDDAPAGGDAPEDEAAAEAPPAEEGPVRRGRVLRIN